MTTLIIAEKPSVARDIARVVGARSRREGFLEGNGYRVSWCVGHLLELREPHEYDPAWRSWSTKTLPMIPTTFATRPRKGAGKQLAVLRRLARAPGVERVINACDAGREGELIFRWVWDAVRPKGRGPRLERLWISSLTDKAIRQGMSALRPASAFDRLADAARSRSEADWLIGVNATRGMTLLGRRGGSGRAVLSVGRVQTPTLAMLAAREDEIDAFEPEPFWGLTATLRFAAGEVTARYQDAEGRERLPREAAARTVASAVADAEATVTDAERKESRRQAPPLHDLTALQKDANRRFGMSAKRTLGAAQGLYERHKALTYPRTDSRYLTPDVAGRLPRVLDALRRSPWAGVADAAIAAGARPRRRVVNPAEVGDHHAILPTGKVPELGRLTADERKIYELVVRRTLAVHLPAAVFAKTRLTFAVAGEEGGPHSFVAEGTTRLEAGWELAEPPPPRRAAAQAPEQALPALAPGERGHVADVEVTAGETKPPPRYSEATLLAAMETAGKQLDEDELRRAMRAGGLGTPATRAAIIETLLDRRFIKRDGKTLIATPQGRALIAALPSPLLKSPELTGRWEAALARMAEGEADRAAFMEQIAHMTADVVRQMRVAEAPKALGEAVGDANNREVLGACPLCGEPVTEGFKAYTCATGKACSFVIFKSIARRKISPNLVRVLIARRRSQKLKGFRSKAGKRFSAVLVLGEDGRVQFDFGDTAESRAKTRTASTKRSKTRAKAKSATPDAPKRARDPRPRCPKCRRGRVMAGRRGWGCSAYRDGCDFVVWFHQGEAGHRVPDDEAERLFRKKQTRLMEGLVAGARARLVLDLDAPGHVRIELSKRAKRT